MGLQHSDLPVLNFGDDSGVGIAGVSIEGRTAKVGVGASFVSIDPHNFAESTKFECL